MRSCAHFTRSPPIVSPARLSANCLLLTSFLVFVKSVSHALNARRTAELHYRLFVHAAEALARANDDAILAYVNSANQLSPDSMDMFFANPDDKEHVDTVVARALETKSLEQRQLEHLQANPTSPVLRLDESQPHSPANSFHTPVSPPQLGPSVAALLPTSSAVTVVESDAPMPSPTEATE